MNKRIFTLMAAAMLLGAPMSNLAFAANPAPTTEEVNIAAKNLANGVKFILKTDNGYAKVAAVEKTKYCTVDVTNASAEEASVFEIRNYSNKTFELWVDGKQFVTNGANAATADKANNKSFYAVKGGAAYGKTDFTSINTVELGTSGTVVYTATAQTKKITLDAEALNKNMSGKGFSFQFPGAKSTPDKNPFGNQMVAVNAQEVLVKLGLGTEDTEAESLVFAVANEAGLKLVEENGITAEDVKAATFVVVDPQTTFGITGFGDGEGHDFTTVKGDKLKANNAKKDSEIAYVNGVYKVEEEDALGAAGQYTISVANLKVKKGNDENYNVSSFHVGAYSLTTGGLKSYVTTVKVSASRSYAKAQTTGNTWAKASDILNTTGAAIYNIYFTGVQPSDEDASTSLYGTYLVSSYATAGTTFNNVSLAPNKVDLKAPSAQWAVIDMRENGEVTFQNVETNETFDASLYKTTKAGIYDAYNTEVGGKEADQIKLVPVTTTEGFLTLSDTQLKQKAQLIFNGENDLVVSEVYMTYDGEDDKFIPVSDAGKSQYWTVVKAVSVKNQFDYIYLKDNEITTKEDADMLSIQSYYLTTKNADKKTVGLKYSSSDLKLVEVGDEIADDLHRVVFKKNTNGTYAVIIVTDKLDAEDAEDNYSEVVKANAQKLYVESANSIFSQIAVASDKDYSNVTISLNSLGESLEAAPRHATLNSEEGAISFKANKNGILEGIIAAEGMTFWLDTADSQAEMPTFYISKGSVDSTSVDRNFLYYATDSMYYWNENKAKYDVNADYALEGSYTGQLTVANKDDADVKAIFRSATLAGIDTLNTTVNGEAVVVAKEAKEDVCLGGVENFKYYITKVGSGYVISPMNEPNLYLYNLNGKLGFTGDAVKALVVTIGAGDPTSNDAIETESSINVIAGNGTIEIQGAAGKKVSVTNVLGKSIANTVLTSDNATITAPAGIVVVAVEGEEAVKAVVK
ncbi:DUF6383 domain-containing protein [uncultured Parabacteroides sp.]|uniref:DUF6383 domain-containing protein n=1 Tax=uncultured Parabacteroides sp. TaxID=512312 RepID=UPI0026019E1F|nr:DUF6383 domain-containing protein [uncultured Parabacteroides sp.]